MASKTFATQCFLTDYSNRKTVKKKKKPVERPQQILTNYRHISWKASNCCDYSSRLSGSPALSGKVFLITFKFS